MEPNNQPTNQPANTTPENQPANQPTNTPENTTPALDLSDLFPTETPNNQPTNIPTNTPAAGDEFDDEGKKIVSHVDKKLTDSADQINQSVDKKVERTQELLMFFNDKKNEPFAPYQKEIARVAHDRKYAGLKIERAIALALGPDTLMKIGAKLAEQASTQAAANATGGNSNNTSVNDAGKKNFWDMSKEDFAKHTQTIMQKQR